MVNRPKPFLGNLVSEHQSAFVVRRQIHDNSLIAQEAFHFMKIKKKGKKCDLALKLDINKAYDRVEWDFLEATMRKMGFNDRWINWTMECVKTVSYSLIINVLSRNIVRRHDKELILRSPRLSSLQMHLIHLRDRNNLRVKAADNPGVYLGIPLMRSKTKCKAMSFVRDRIIAKLTNWKQQTLSQGGKEILIKAVALALPTYIMACFLFPKRICKDINAAYARFWWGQKGEEKKIH